MYTFLETVPVAFLAGWLAKSTLLLLVALGATALLRRAPAGTRHVVWLATLAGIVLLPGLQLWSPLRLPILPRVTVPVREAPARAAAPSMVAAPERIAHERPAVAASVPDGAVASASSLALIDGSAGPILTEPRFPLGLTALVLAGGVALGLLGWLALGALTVRAIVADGTPLGDPAWTAALCESADRLDLDAVPRLVASDRVEMPFACGLLQPTIVLPASAAAWSEDRRRAVLFHELAHVRRRDLFGHTLGRIACALYWFHPLVWTAARKLRAESERACDDLVLACGARASDYADHLLDLVVGARHHAAPAPALPMARRRELEGRVLAILDPAIPRSGPGRAQAVLLGAGCLVVALVAGASAPAPAAGRPRAELAAREAEHTAPREQRPALTREASEPLPAAPSVGATGSVPRAAPLVTSPAPTPGTRLDQRVSTVTESLTSSATGVAVKLLENIGVTGARNWDTRQVPGAPLTRGDSDRIVLLARMLRTDSQAEVRKVAAWGLSRATGVSIVSDALIAALRGDEDAEVREMAAWALSHSTRDADAAVLAEALGKDRSAEVRETAVWALGNHAVVAQTEAITRALGDESRDVRESAAWALGEVSPAKAPASLVAALGDADREVRETAAWALAEIHDPASLGAVRAAFVKERDRDVRLMELRTLAMLGDDSPEVRAAALASDDAEMRAQAVRMLAGLGQRAWPMPQPRPRPRPNL